jgi:hypothetical protein
MRPFDSRQLRKKFERAHTHSLDDQKKPPRLSHPSTSATVPPPSVAPFPSIYILTRFIMLSGEEGLWAAIAERVRDVELDEIARIIGSKRIQDNQVRCRPSSFIPFSVLPLSHNRH